MYGVKFGLNLGINMFKFKYKLTDNYNSIATLVNCTSQTKFKNYKISITDGFYPKCRKKTLLKKKMNDNQVWEEIPVGREEEQRNEESDNLHIVILGDLSV